MVFGLVVLSTIILHYHYKKCTKNPLPFLFGDIFTEEMYFHSESPSSSLSCLSACSNVRAWLKQSQLSCQSACRQGLVWRFVYFIVVLLTNSPSDRWMALALNRRVGCYHPSPCPPSPPTPTLLPEPVEGNPRP